MLRMCSFWEDNDNEPHATHLFSCLWLYFLLVMFASCKLKRPGKSLHAVYPATQGICTACTLAHNVLLTLDHGTYVFLDICNGWTRQIPTSWPNLIGIRLTGPASPPCGIIGGVMPCQVCVVLTDGRKPRHDTNKKACCAKPVLPTSPGS